MDSFAADDLTDDAFLGGQLSILQLKRGYRAGVDPVLLAAAVPARPGEAVLELGCGAGVASLCLARRCPDLRLTGLERQHAYAALAQENAERNGVEMEVLEGDLAAMPSTLRERQFDQVLANPPYYDRSAGTGARDAGREASRGEETPLSAWLETGARRLRQGGWLTVIQRADRLCDVILALPQSLGSIAMLPIAPRVGRDAVLVIVQARKGGRAAMRLLSTVIMHDGDAHLTDGDDYSAIARGVLRDGSALPLR